MFNLQGHLKMAGCVGVVPVSVLTVPAHRPPAPRHAETRTPRVLARSPAFVLRRGAHAPMRLIGLAVVLTVSLVLAPLAGEVQQAGKVYRIGFLRDDSYRVCPLRQLPRNCLTIRADFPSMSTR